MSATAVEVSVVMPFADHEDEIAAACARTATYLRAQDCSFEIVAVDEGSGDNSGAVVQLLMNEIPELRMALAFGRGRGVSAGVEAAVGRVVAVVTPGVAARKSFAALGRAVRRVGRREIDAALVGDLYTVCHRTECLPILRSGAANRLMGQKLIRRARSRGLRVESYELGGSQRQRPGWSSFMNFLRPSPLG